MGQKTLSTAGLEILQRNPYRRSLIFHNPSTITIWLDRSTANGITITNASIRLPEGAIVAINWLQDGADAVVDQWSAVAVSGTPVLVITEFVGRNILTTDMESGFNGAVKA
mgnify:CR=1 FL=1